MDITIFVVVLAGNGSEHAACISEVRMTTQGYCKTSQAAQARHQAGAERKDIKLIPKSGNSRVGAYLDGT
jgi:hypothetical protein